MRFIATTFLLDVPIFSILNLSGLSLQAQDLQLLAALFPIKLSLQFPNAPRSYPTKVSPISRGPILSIFWNRPDFISAKESVLLQKLQTYRRVTL